MWGGALEGFILSSYLETFRRAVWGGGLDGLVETFTPPLFHWKEGGLEGFILGSYLETFRKGVGGGTRGFHIRFLFRNLQEGRLGGGDSMVWSKPSPPPLFQAESLERGGLKSYLETLGRQSGRGGLDGLVETFTPPLFQGFYISPI